MNTYDPNPGFIRPIETLRIPLIVEDNHPKQCFYLSNEELNVTMSFPCSDGSQIAFRFSKITSGEDIEESMVYDLIHKTNAGKRLHQRRIDDMHEAMRRTREDADDAWLKGFRAGANDASWHMGVHLLKNTLIASMVSFTFGIIVGFFL